MRITVMDPIFAGLNHLDNFAIEAVFLMNQNGFNLNLTKTPPFHLNFRSLCRFYFVE